MLMKCTRYNLCIFTIYLFDFDFFCIKKKFRSDHYFIFTRVNPSL